MCIGNRRVIVEKENHSAEKKPMREYTPWDYVKPGIAIAAFAVGLIFVLFKFDAVSKRTRCSEDSHAVTTRCGKS